MADERTPEEDHKEYMRAYQQGMVAARLSETESGTTYIPGAAINLAKDVGLITGPASVYEEVVRATPEAEANLLRITSQRYAEHRDQIKIGELLDSYIEGGKVSDNVSEEVLAEYRALLVGDEEKTIVQLKNEIKVAEHVLNPLTTGSTDQAKRDAKETIARNKNSIVTLSVLEAYSLEAGRQRAVQASMQGTLERMVERA